MTTPDPQTDRGDDDGREHRSIGQRIRDAVLGDPEDDARHDEPGGAGPADRDATREGGYAQGDRTDVGFADPDHGNTRTGAGYGPVKRDPDRPDDGYAAAASGAARTDTGSDTGHDTGRDDTGYTDTRYTDAGYGDSHGSVDADTPRTDADYADSGRAEAPAGDPTDLGRDDSTRRDVGGREYDSRGYDASTDTGYLDDDRTDTDRTTGRRDADYDTGRVDGGDSYRDTRPGAGTVGAVAAGSAAAAGVAGASATRRDNEPGDRSGARFSDVDDTSIVEPTTTGRATPDTPVSTGAVPASSAGATSGASAGTATGGTAAASRAEAVSDDNDDEESGGRERLVPAERARDYGSRWDALKGDFVDEPQRAVAQADDLVKELLDEINQLFATQRRDLEQGFDHDKASTEDLRLALRRYRSFFDRLLSF